MNYRYLCYEHALNTVFAAQTACVVRRTCAWYVTLAVQDLCLNNQPKRKHDCQERSQIHVYSLDLYTCGTLSALLREVVSWECVIQLCDKSRWLPFQLLEIMCHNWFVQLMAAMIYLDKWCDFYFDPVQIFSGMHCEVIEFSCVIQITSLASQKNRVSIDTCMSCSQSVASGIMLIISYHGR